MITITESAREYLGELLSKQEDALGVRVFINQPGTPRAETCIAYCREGDIETDDAVNRIYTNQLEHDPSDLDAARSIADREDVLPIGLLFQDKERPRYEEFSVQGLRMTTEEKLRALGARIRRQNPEREPVAAAAP